MKENRGLKKLAIKEDTQDEKILTENDISKGYQDSPERNDQLKII